MDLIRAVYENLSRTSRVVFEDLWRTSKVVNEFLLRTFRTRGPLKVFQGSLHKSFMNLAAYE